LRTYVTDQAVEPAGVIYQRTGAEYAQSCGLPVASFAEGVFRFEPMHPVALSYWDN
jgi:hypothetical protein